MTKADWQLIAVAVLLAGATGLLCGWIGYSAGHSTGFAAGSAMTKAVLVGNGRPRLP